MAWVPDAAAPLKTIENSSIREEASGPTKNGRPHTIRLSCIKEDFDNTSLHTEKEIDVSVPFIQRVETITRALCKLVKTVRDVVL